MGETDTGAVAQALALFGYCETCGSPRTSAIVPTSEGPRDQAVGLQCSAVPEHGPDAPSGPH